MVLNVVPLRESHAGQARTAAAPAKIELTTFALYKQQGEHVLPLYGVQDARIAADGKIELVAGNAPFLSDSFGNRAPKPGHGLLMLYGINDKLEQLHRWRRKAAEMEARFAYACLTFDVGYIEPGLTGRKQLREYATVAGNKRWPSRFLNVRRTKSDLRCQLLESFRTFSAREGETTPADMPTEIQLGTRPDHVDRLFQEDKDFREQLDILVIPVADDPEEPRRVRQLAYVRPGAKLVAIEQGSDERIVLPRWFTNAGEAAALREAESRRHMGGETRVGSAR